MKAQILVTKIAAIVMEKNAIQISVGYSLTPVELFVTALKGCQGIAFTHGVRMGWWAGGGKSLSGLYLGNHKV